VKHYFRTIAALAVIFIGSALVPALKADEWDKKTILRVDQSIEIQGTVLPPGLYVMRLLDSFADRHAVGVFSARDNHLIVSVQALPAYRLAITDDSKFNFYEGAEGRPPELRTWFYPGDNFGFEFRPSSGESAAQSARRQTNATSYNAGGN